MSEKKGLKKEIGLVTLTSIGVGAILGSGIFALPAVMGQVAGPSLILAILLSGIISLFLAIAYTELGAAFPIEGGPYSLPRLALGDLGGFLMGWGYFLYLFIGTSAIIDIFVVYLGFYIPGLAIAGTLTPLGVTIAVLFVWIFTFINILGVKWGGLYSVVTTIGKLIPLVLFTLIGLVYFKGGNLVPFMPNGFMGVTLAITLFFWSYTGFEAIVVPTEEVRKPSRTIPLSMLLTMSISILVYVMIALVFVGMLDWNGLHLSRGDWKGIGQLSSPLSDASSGVGLPWLAAIMTIGAIIATAGSGGSWILIQGRMPYAMAKDKLFWSPLAKVHPKFGTPAASLIFTSILTTVVLIALPNFPSVALISSVTAVVPYAAAVLAVPILRKTKPDVARPYKLPMMRVVTVLGFIFSSFLIYWASWPWTLVGALLVLSGYLAYFFVKSRNYEFKRNLWIIVYLVGIVTVSILGDPHFVFNNFTPWEPMGVFTMPYDLIVLALFSIAIYIWAYKENVKEEFIEKKKTDAELK